MDLDWPKFSAYQMRTMQNEPAVGPKPVGGNPRIMQWAQPSYGQGVGGAVYQSPESLPRSFPPMTGGSSAPVAQNNWMSKFMANGGVLPPEAPSPTVNMSAMRGSPTSTVGYSMGKAASAPRAFGAPFSVPPSAPAEAAAALPKFGSVLGTIGRVAGPVGIAVGSYNATNEMLDPNSAPRQRFASAGSDAAGGNYGSAAKNAYYGVGDVVGTFTGLKPLARMIAGSDRPSPISIDAQGNFSRAPTNMDEYKQMMDMKPKASMSTYSELGIQPPAQAMPAAKAAPAMSYNDWVMKQPVSKLNATDYAARANLEIEKRAPELMQRNIEAATAYQLAHPDMVTSETHHRDGSWSKTYGNRADNAIAGYSSFKNALASEGYHNALAQAALTRAENSEKFNASDKLGMVGEQQQKMMQALGGNGDERIPVATRIRNARAYWPSFLAALKANGVDPSSMDFDSFIQEQTGAVADPQYPGTYKLPK